VSASDGGRPFEDELAELLERRALRSKVDPGLLGRVAAQASASRQDRVGWWAEAVRSFAPARRTAASLVALVAIVSLVGAALFVGGGSRPSVSPSPSASGLVAGPTQVTAYRFTSVDFVRSLRQQPDAFVGHTVLVDGTLSETTVSCVRASFDCPPMQFGGAQPGDPDVIPADQVARDSVGAGATGTFAIEVVTASDLRLLGLVQLSASGQPWRPSALQDQATVTVGHLYATSGWLVRGGMVLDCPKPQPTPAPDAPVYGCPDNEWLTDDEYQPWADGRDKAPDAALYLPSGSYDGAGRSSPPTGPPFPPRQAIYLLAPWTTSCVPLASCASPVPSRWRLAGEIDPVALSAPSSVETVDRLPAGDFHSALRAQPDAFVGHTILVDGTLTLVPWPCPSPASRPASLPVAAVNCPPFTFGSDGDSGPLVFAASAAVRAEAGGPTSGTFAIRVESPTRLIDLGRVTLSSAGNPWAPSGLTSLARPADGLYAVDGFLNVAPGTFACPFRRLDLPGWCPPTWIGDAADQSVTPGSDIPGDAIRGQGSAPHDLGISDLPAHGTYLVRRFDPDEQTCAQPGAGPSCDVGDGWLVVGRLEPVTLATPPSPQPSDVAQADPTVTDAASLPSVLPTLAAGSTILVRGTIVAMTWCKAVDCPATFDGEPRSSAVSVLAGGDMPDLPTAGTFAVRVTGPSGVRYVDTVVRNGDHLSWGPLELARSGPTAETAYVVTGWLVPHRGAAACPWTPGQPSPSLAVCIERPAQLVEDEATAMSAMSDQKVQSVVVKSMAGGLEPGQPESGYYVVRRATVPACGPTADCFGGLGLAYVVDAKLHTLRSVASSDQPCPLSSDGSPQPCGP
jgi:hypothetical protein